MHVACAVLRQFVSLGQAEIRHVAGFCRIRKMRKTGFRPEPELRLWEGQNLGRPIYGSRLCSVGGVDWGGKGKAENEYGDGGGGGYITGFTYRFLLLVSIHMLCASCTHHGKIGSEPSSSASKSCAIGRLTWRNTLTLATVDGRLLLVLPCALACLKPTYTALTYSLTP